MSESDAVEFIDSLEAIMAVVIDKARTDEAFRKNLARAVLNPQKFKGKAKRTLDYASVAPDIDAESVFKDQGAEGLRKTLGALTHKKIYALVRSKGINPRGTSSMNKGQLIEHVIRTVRNQSSKHELVY